MPGERKEAGRKSQRLLAGSISLVDSLHEHLVSVVLEKNGRWRGRLDEAHAFLPCGCGKGNNLLQVMYFFLFVDGVVRSAMKDIARVGPASILCILVGCSQVAPFVPTPMPVVERMLELANVTQDDVVYDLGSGDGRIVIAAARKYGSRAVGLEIDPELVREARKNIVLAKVDHLVEIRQQDILTADFSDATVITMYLGPSANIRLKPILKRQLRPGSRIVSHEYDMEDWEPENTEEVVSAGDTYVLYLWQISRAPR